RPGERLQGRNARRERARDDRRRRHPAPPALPGARRRGLRRLVRHRAPRRRDRCRGLRGGGAARARAVSGAVDLSPEGQRRVAAVTGGRLPAFARVAAGTLSLSCLVWGEGEPTAVLVHGNGGHAHWWDALVPGLVQGWRLVAPDLRGHGESEW